MVGSAKHVVQLLVEGKDDNELLLLTTLTQHHSHSICMVRWPQRHSLNQRTITQQPIWKTATTIEKE